MIAVDTSAIIAMIRHEPEEPRFRTLFGSSDGALISAGNVLELQLVLAGERALGVWSDVEIIFDAYGIRVHPFDEAQAHIAREAALRFGKGRHKAALNFGDCFAYALAKSQGLPLLCKGDDFALTDIEIA